MVHTRNGIWAWKGRKEEIAYTAHKVITLKKHMGECKQWQSKQQKPWTELLYITTKFVMEITGCKPENLILNWYGFERERNTILGL